MVSIICKHQDTAILRMTDKPDGLDSGKLYACDECWRKKDLNIDNWVTICEDCIHRMLEARMKNIIL